ncbi:phage major capsid protein [Clostridium sp. AF18-27]|uniref:phage major capsid protein n=1 Tax=Enterocloster lavalensis TaxID=460384 RepID=UPI000E4D0A07|nr:phage major capsid protein [Enterocloster lavalensis]RHR52104.1 phage major capsid protein [Clostridium sp. AF18-27]
MRKKAIVRQYMQYRAEDLKSLTEQRAELVQQMKDLTGTAETEKRAFSEEEDQQFEDLDKKVKALDSTIEKLERARDLKLNVTSTEKHEELKQEELEERAFAAYIRGERLQERADVNLTAGDNGAVIPTSIAQKIIKKVVDICPIYQLATRYNVGGTLSIPYYDEDTQTIEMAYATEFQDLESTSGKFGSIELKGFLAGALSKVSKSLVNNSQFDITSFVIAAMAEAISKWIEKELLHGTAEKVAGLSTVKLTVTAAAAAAITADELIDVQEAIPDAYQAGAIWIMNKAIRTAIRKLKDNDGNYILNKDATARWGYTLFGKDVYTSDNMPAMEAGKTVIYYGDMSGLAVKLSEDVSIEVLREKFATQHAIGVVGWIEIDSKVENAQKIAKLVMKASA